jgi:septum formation protein
MLENLQKYQILLASKSPRRRELLSQMRIPFKPISLGGIDESYPDSLPATDVPLYISNKKADAYKGMLKDDELIITADTLVILGDKIMGKPKDGDDAVNMLMELAGKTHQVITAVCIMTKEKRSSFNTTTDVTFAALTREEVEFYVENYQPLDKAGAYGIQEWIGCVAVKGINGSFYNVMGLPVHQLYNELKKF